MRQVCLFLTLVFIGGLLVSSQVSAAGQYREDTNLYAALTGEQLRQWHLAQERVEHQGQVHYQGRVHATVLSSEQIREMQRLLNQRGYSIGSNETDTIGQETMSALHNFQRDQGLAVTGMPNHETLQALSPSSGHDEFFGLAPSFGEPVD